MSFNFKCISVFGLLSSIVLCQYSCNDPEPIPNYLTCNFIVPECDPNLFSPNSDSIIEIKKDSCVIDLGRRTLLGDSKKYFWPFCPSVHKLIYKDSSGNIITFSIINKSHKLINNYAYSNGNSKCKDVIYASIDEKMEIILANKEIDLKFKLILEPGGAEPDLFDGLEVNKTTFDDNRQFWSNQVLFLYLNNRNTSNSIVRYRFSSTLILQNETFKNVHWNDGRYNVPMEIYYNQECGLIAFRDAKNVLWKISGFE